jgi:Flp pilus assembly pilin Flp
MIAFRLIRELFADESGASMVEEALILAVMVVAIMWGVVNVTNTLQGGIFGIADAIGEASPAS